MRRAACVAVAFLFAAGVARGQQAAADCVEPKAVDAAVETCPVPSDDAEAAPVAHDTRDYRPQIQVLEHPYDLASFYRADGGQPGFYGRAADRYPIASYYRGGVNPRGYSRFWTSGYTGGERVRYSGYDSLGGRDYRDRIGENGDLFLFAPILAPVGPLSDVFFSVDVR